MLFDTMEFNHCHPDKKYGQRSNSRIVVSVVNISS